MINTNFKDLVAEHEFPKLFYCICVYCRINSHYKYSRKLTDQYKLLMMGAIFIFFVSLYG